MYAKVCMVCTYQCVTYKLFKNYYIHLFATKNKTNEKLIYKIVSICISCIKPRMYELDYV